MASTETGTQDTLKTVSSEPDALTPNAPTPNYFRVDFVLRLLLLVSCVAALVVLVTAKETKVIAVLPPPFGAVFRADAKFNYSPALIYLLVALAVVSLYSIKTVILSCLFTSRKASAQILFSLLLFDILMTGIMASALGTAGGIAYVALKGNTHTNWMKICHIYGKFCGYMGASIFLSLFASIVLVLLVVLSAYSLYKRSH